MFCFFAGIDVEPLEALVQSLAFDGDMLKALNKTSKASVVEETTGLRITDCLFVALWGIHTGHGLSLSQCFLPCPLQSDEPSAAVEDYSRQLNEGETHSYLQLHSLYVHTVLELV